MNTNQKRQFTTLVTSRINSLRNTVSSGTGRSVATKESNCIEIIDLLQELHFNTTDGDITEGAAILGAALGNRAVEWQRPPQDNGAAQKLAALNADSSGVSHVINGVTVHLDCDQLKHQPPTLPIGTRQKGGGNKFNNTCDAAWHQANTMAHMSAWAIGLGPMAAGQKTYHGQMIPVNDICYEGYCLFANGQKYVAFHCYPTDASPLKL